MYRPELCIYLFIYNFYWLIFDFFLFRKLKTQTPPKKEKRKFYKNKTKVWQNVKKKCIRKDKRQKHKYILSFVFSIYLLHLYEQSTSTANKINK